MEKFKNYGKKLLSILIVITDITMILFGLLMMLVMGFISMMIIIDGVDKYNMGDSVLMIVFFYFTNFFMNKIIWHLWICRIINQYEHIKKFGGKIGEYHR